MIDLATRLTTLGMTADDVRREISQRTWFHSFDLGNGIKIPGCDPSDRKLRALGLPPDLKGKTVIDVGAYDGFFSFECERRGAARVVACDHFVWTTPGFTARENVEFLQRLFDSQVELLELPVEALSPQTAGEYDIVLFLGVLYHAPDPIGYLKNIRSITRELLILETLVDVLDVDRPAAAFYPGASLNDDDTNYWGPNVLAMEAMLKKVGFSRVEALPLWDVNTCEMIKPSARQQIQSPRSPWQRATDRADLELRKLRSRFGKVRNGRMVFHAYP